MPCIVTISPLSAQTIDRMGATIDGGVVTDRWGPARLRGAAVGEQRRGRRIAMTPAEVDDFLGAQRTCRVATVGATGAPHVVPLWFVWDGEHLWLHSLTNSQRWTDLLRDGRVAVVVDTGDAYLELRGVELTGVAHAVGDIPRTGVPNPDLTEPERLWADKYVGGGEFRSDGRHGWLRIVVDRVVSWDFRKIGAS